MRALDFVKTHVVIIVWVNVLRAVQDVFICAARVREHARQHVPIHVQLHAIMIVENHADIHVWKNVHRRVKKAVNYSVSDAHPHVTVHVQLYALHRARR